MTLPRYAESEGVNEFLVISPSALVEEIAPAFVVLHHADTHARLRLSRPMYDLLRRFTLPGRISEVLSPLGSQAARAETGVAALRAAQFLIVPTPLFFQCSALAPDGASETREPKPGATEG